MGFLSWTGPGRDASVQLWNGNSWEGEKPVPAGISESPSAVVYGDRLIVFYQGANHSSTLFFSEFKSTGKGGSGTWTGNTQVPGMMMSSSPSAVTINNKIYIFHRAAANGKSLWGIVYTMGKFSADDEFFDMAMANSPGAVLFNNTIYCFHQGQGGSNSLWYKTITPR